MLLAAGLGGCTGGHHVSPWGEEGAPSLRPFLLRPDLQEQLSVIDHEAAELGLRLTHEVRGDLGAGEPVVIRAYEGHDAFGRPIHAARAASPRGVVMALGPPHEGEVIASEIVFGAEDAPHLGRPGVDMNGDGAPEVVLRDALRRLQVVRLDGLGSTPIAVKMLVAPTRLLDLDGDGRAELGADVVLGADAPLTLRFQVVAAWDGARFSDDAPAARAFYVARRASLEDPKEAPEAATTVPVGTTPPPAELAPEPPEARLGRALARAVYAVLGAEMTPKQALVVLDRQVVPKDFAASFEGLRAYVAGLQNRVPTP